MYSANQAAQAASGIHISLPAEDLTPRPACIIIASDIIRRTLADFCRLTPSATMAV